MRLRNPLRRRVRAADAIPATHLGVTPIPVTICAICGHEQTRYIYRNEERKQCRNCGLPFIWRWPHP